MTRSHLVTPVQDALTSFSQGSLTASAMSHTAREQTDLLAALPPTFVAIFAFLAL